MIEPTRRIRTALIGLAAFVTMSAAVLGCKSHAVQSATDPATPQFYEDQVRPIFQSNCFRCHSGLNHRGGLQLDTREHILHGGKDGAVIVPGHPEQSLLLTLVRHEGPAKDPMPMPPKSKLSHADIARITQWIQAGAVMPKGADDD